MQDESINLEELKRDKEFQENLKLLEEEVKNSDSIAKAYQLLDVKLAISPEDEEPINELFQKIVNGSFSSISEKLEKAEKLDLSNPEEWAVARGIYEYAMQKYSEDDKKSAQELFLALSYTIDDSQFKDAMMLHAAAIEKGYSFDDFISKIAKIDESNLDDPKSLFITTFTQPVDILLELFDKEVQKLNLRLKKLKKAQEGE